MRVYAKHEPYWNTGHLGKVIEEMRVLGPPEIDVVEFDGKYMALEGSHRLAASLYLGLTPKLNVLKPDVDSSRDSWWLKVIFDLPVYTFKEGEHS